MTKWQTPLLENEEIVELPVDQRTITRRCTDRGVEFIRENKDRPDVMLFNLAEDIGEENNLAEANPELVERLRRRMIELDAAIAAEARPPWSKP